MKRLFYLITLTILSISCSASKPTEDTTSNNQISKDDIVTIANDDIEYEITIIEPGFNAWLRSIARPKGYYTQSYMELHNWNFVQEYNNRVLNPQQYNPRLYELQIDYQPTVDYGYDVNYKLFNYFIYFQLTYKQRLTAYVPRI
ncbi:DUF6146 family protein [Psychroserpens sp.]|uniref:DUF6146 family protein n=1 Tax=Psychroserpens sp. TaxID=2020870 RepID=UPI001B18791D|nr:DUF6146 family protein [Psychroserpens sp.]MBO6606544.1 hypothetical protein [Psychroserpens sp.]MBO6632767.1 hypothetical protein [Psychroserpens sp.]MBO6653248.1 hypothetical protein [Psychroserpens sp.]MBO6680725.1 hypothetical protein [Psychroserpens sp.]MBO6750317.1 hypothetical protein [Psychroserpens sp.]